MNWTLVLVGVIQGLTAIVSATVAAIVSYRWGQQALALKDQLIAVKSETIAAKEAQLALVQQLSLDAIKAKEMQLDSLKQLTAPGLVEHFQGLQSIYEGLLAQANARLAESDANLRTPQANPEERERIELELTATRTEITGLNARLDDIQSLLIHMEQFGSYANAPVEPEIVEPVGETLAEPDPIQLALLESERGQRRRARLVAELRYAYETGALP